MNVAVSASRARGSQFYLIGGLAALAAVPLWGVLAISVGLVQIGFGSRGGPAGGSSK